MKFAMFLVAAACLLHLATSKKISKFQLDDLIEDFVEMSQDAGSKCTPVGIAAIDKMMAKNDVLSGSRRGPDNGMTIGGTPGCQYVEKCRPGLGGIQVCHTKCVCTNVG